MALSLSRVAGMAGTLLALVSIGFVVALLWSQRAPLLAFRPGASGVAVLLLCLGAYATADAALARAWRLLLLWSGEASVDPATARRIYARTQIAKYVPGNVAQFVGRQLVGRQAGWSHAGLILSTAFEMLTLVLVASAVALFGISTANVGALVDPVLVWSVSAALVFFGYAVLQWFPIVIARRWPDTAQRLARCRLRDLWGVAALYLVFFLTGGFILVALTNLVSDQPIPWSAWTALCSLFAVGWIAGTLTPGAPSGIGIRELVLVTGLALVAPAATAILVATLLRVVTVGGDVLFFFLAGHRRAR